MNYESVGDLEFGGGNIKVDPAIAAHLPKGCRITSIEKHGVSFWANTGQIVTQLQDGTTTSYFIKVISQEVGREMMRSEYESMTAIHQVRPKFVPRPIAWGSYETWPDTHFFLCEFRDMAGDDDLPVPHGLAEPLAALHQESRSPTGDFGFHMNTYSGNLLQHAEWEASWQAFFTKNFRKALDLEIAAKGYDPEFDILVPKILDKVIPRLLGPLESEGRSVKPCLVHGDLWYANSGVDINNADVLVFDACCFYAHNEYEFGQWRPACNRFGPEYLEAYHDFVQKSQPVEDYDGRLDLYKLRFNTHVSALFKDSAVLREQMLGDMRDLIQRYG